ncbi:glycoside hydrolase family 97 catalytic domain-containing protein [Allokutzneria oryzae]|uniref:Glycoside hydrolase family 97 catalytic domain-containing protein n=1 Tax=Allokutzneria oryzae TaxID=1378989 RepID=A0ABV6A2A5_9PSEU
MPLRPAHPLLASAVTAAMVVSLSSPAMAAPPDNAWTVRGPGGVSALVKLDPGSGSVALSVERHGKLLIAPSPVGIRTTAADLTKGLRATGRQNRVVTQQYRMTTGKRLNRTAVMNETRFSFAGAANTRLDLVVRAAPDGVAYRYELPGARDVVVTGEASAFALPGDATAWLMPYNAQHENKRQKTTASAAPTGDYGNPSLFQVGDDYVLLTESDVDGRYAGSSLSHQSGSGTYAVALKDQQIRSTGQTPWRTAIVGDLGAVTESTLVDDLAIPARFTDTSWVRPGKVAWSWLSEHSSPKDFERQKAYVDFAARNGWPYVLVDEGWSDKWVPELARYARAKGVDILLWFHWTSLDTQPERDTVLARVKDWGVKGVKVDFMESDSQARYQWYDTILAETAKRQLMVNFHGSTIPHGLARTWPHVMSMEAIHGAEQNPQPDNDPVHPFVRNVVGSMDYTPGRMETGNKVSTIGHEIALPAAYESAWQHFADKPEAYEKYPEALRFLNQLPTVWDQTEYVSGYPGSDAVIARRNGNRWFVGGVAAGGARTLRAPLAFLGPGRWLVETVRDPRPGQRVDVQRTTSVQTSSATLDIDVHDNGGFGAVICPATPGRLTCYEPVRQVAETSLAITPTSTVDAAAGTSFEVTGTFEVRSARTVTDVVLTPQAPAGWTVQGAPVTAPALGQGRPLSGKWTVKVGANVKPGTFELPVVAEFWDPALARRVHVAKAVRGFVPPNGRAYVSDLSFETETNGYGPVERDRSNNDAAGGDGNQISIGGRKYEKGLGTHATAEISVYLGGKCTAFSSVVGMDDETTSPGSSAFQVLGDGKVLAETGVLRTGGQPVPLSASVIEVRTLTLRVTDGGDGKNFDHADWADAVVDCG